MLAKTAAALLLASGQAQAFWRMQCFQPIVQDRVDPIVEPGKIPARHIHNVMGASGFSPNSGYEELQNSKCTSCRVKGDNSVYWVPSMYFMEKSTGKMSVVPQKQDMLVYYLPERGVEEGVKIEAFPAGFQMIAGDPTIRNFSVGIQPTEASRRQRGIGFNCLNYAGTPEGFLQRRKLPTTEEMQNCLNGLRADIAFPSCWNGELDSPDHRSHMAYPYDVEDGSCPDTHPRRLVSILYETLFDVSQFFGKDGDFVFANGDATGYGYHGDFLAGWQPDLLETAMADKSCVPDQITATGGVIENCQTFVNGGHLQTDDEMGSCTIEQKAEGNFLGPMASLPGCNKISWGPEPAAECDDGEPLEGPASEPIKSAPAAKSTPKPKVVSSTPVAAPAPVAPSASPVTESLLGANFFNHNQPAAQASVAAAVAPVAAAVDDDNVVVVVQTVTQTLTSITYAKRTAAPEAHEHKRHAHAHAHRRRRWF